tara:strand:- start:679 stop:1383 length:705 start_codon:yes stop_codon:yes gene_type:complete
MANDGLTKFDKMSMKELRKLAKIVGFNTRGMSKEVLADSIHQFNGLGMFPKKMEKGGSPGLMDKLADDLLKSGEKRGVDEILGIDTGGMSPAKIRRLLKEKGIVFKQKGGKVGTMQKSLDLKKETGFGISNADKARLQKALGTLDKTGRTISNADIDLIKKALTNTNKGGVTNRPKPMKKGGAAFPDLTGDGKVTKKDILRGRGVPGFKRGGAASNVCRGGGAALRGTRFRGVK